MFFEKLEFTGKFDSQAKKLTDMHRVNFKFINYYSTQEFNTTQQYGVCHRSHLTPLKLHKFCLCEKDKLELLIKLEFMLLTLLTQMEFTI